MSRLAAVLSAALVLLAGVPEASAQRTERPTVQKAQGTGPSGSTRRVERGSAATAPATAGEPAAAAPAEGDGQGEATASGEASSGEPASNGSEPTAPPPSEEPAAAAAEPSREAAPGPQAAPGAAVAEPEGASPERVRTSGRPASARPDEPSAPPDAEAGPAPVVIPRLLTRSGEPRGLAIGILPDAAPFSALGRLGVRLGFDVDVALALCSRLEVRCNLIPLSAGESIPALLERRIDAVVASLGATMPDSEEVAYSAPYLELAVRFVVPRESAADLDASQEAVYGAVMDSPQAEYLVRTYSEEDVRLYPSATELWIDLAMARTNAVLAPALSARRAFLSTPMGKPFRFSPTGRAEESLVRNAAIAVRDGDADLLAALDAAIASLLASTDYEEIITRHLDADLARRPSRSR